MCKVKYIFQILCIFYEWRGNMAAYRPVKNRMWYFKKKAIPTAKTIARLFIIVVCVALFYICALEL